MAWQCEICKRKYQKAGRYEKLISRYNPRPKRKQKVNLQWFTFEGKRMKICTRCRRTLLKKIKEKQKAL